MPEGRRSSTSAPRVKVCGLTRAEDVGAAVRAGADALGFVWHPPSPRHVPPAELGALLAAARREATEAGRAVATVLVCVDPDARELAELLAGHDLDRVQLCGTQTPEAARALAAATGVGVLRRLGVEPGAEAELARWAGVADAFVLDHPASAGGSGRAVDRAVAARLARRAPCLLAGGLDGTTVAAAVRAVRPAGVDAASRLEAAPGRKDPARLAAFVRAARAALDALADTDADADAAHAVPETPR